MKNYEKGLLLLLLLVGAAPAFAQRGHHDRRDNDRYVSSYHSYSYRPVQPYYHVQPYYAVRPYYGRVQPSVSIIAQLPFGAVAVNLGGSHYHYYDGRYYQPGTGGYIIVQ